jgi:hypothetical protein
MNRKEIDTARDLVDHEEFERLVERGRVLHSHAVYDAFAWIVKRVSASMRNDTKTPLAARS